MSPSSTSQAPAERPRTLGEQHHHAFDILLDYDRRARQRRADHELQELHATWFGLQIALGDQSLLLPQQQLAEVLSLGSLTVIPGSPAWLLGLSNHYGQLLPIVDLYGFVYGHRWPDASQQRVIVSDSDPRIGFLVTTLGRSVRCAPPVAKQSALNLHPELDRWVSSQACLASQTIGCLDLAPIIEASTHWKRD